MSGSKRVLAVYNCELEGLGRYGHALHRSRVGVDVVRAYAGEPLPDPRGFDAVIIGGTPVSAYDVADHPPLEAESKWLGQLVALDIPTLGVCCGGQLIARVLRARVWRMPAMEIGIETMHRTAAGRDDPLLAGFPDSFPAFCWHGDAFDLPAGAAGLVAGGPKCPLQAFRYRQVVAALFHLEVSADAARQWTRAYAPELEGSGRTAAEVIASTEAVDAQLAHLAQRLVNNLLQPGTRRA